MEIAESTLIVILIAAVLIFTMMFATICYAIHVLRQMKTERENSSRLLLDQQLQLAEQERCYDELARRLHDKVQQPLLLVRMRNKETDWEQVRNELWNIIGEISDINRSLNYNYMRSYDIRALIQDELKYIEQTTKLQTDLNCEDEPAVCDETKIVLLRIIREAISNIVRHAGATMLLVSLTSYKDKLVLCIADDGMGMHAEKIFGPATRGMENMRRRAAMINASFQVRSTADEGTEVILELKTE